MLTRTAHIALLAIVAVAVTAIAAWAAAPHNPAPVTTPYHPKIDSANFGGPIDNPYLPLKPGTVFRYKGVGDDGKTHELNIVRVTHRKTDPSRTTDFQPMHSHDVHEAMKPGEVYEVDLEIWPASLHLPKGSTLSLTVQGQDFKREDGSGSGPFTHTDGVDRQIPRYDNRHTIYTGGARASYLQLPVLPG